MVGGAIHWGHASVVTMMSGLLLKQRPPKLRASGWLATTEEAAARPVEGAQAAGRGRARAYALTGDFLAEEPDCAYPAST